MEGFVKDARLGFRMLLRTPLLSIVAVLTIGLGVGATSFAFSVVYGTMGRGLPVRDADRLMVVSGTRPEEGETDLGVPIHDYLDFRDQQTSFEHLAAGYSGTINLGGDEGPPERYQGGFVSARMLSMLGVQPVLGRTFQDGEDGAGAPPLVVLGHGVWRNRFAGEDVRGRTVRVNGELATIIGVMPEGFRFPFNEDVWVPLRTDPDALPRRGGTSMTVAGYLRWRFGRGRARRGRGDRGPLGRAVPRAERRDQRERAAVHRRVHAAAGLDDDDAADGHGDRRAAGRVRERGERAAHARRGHRRRHGAGIARGRRQARDGAPR